MKTTFTGMSLACTQPSQEELRQLRGPELPTTYGYYSLDAVNSGKSNPSTTIFVLVIIFIVIYLAGIVVALRMKQKEM